MLTPATVQFAFLYFFLRPPFPVFAPPKNPCRSPYHTPHRTYLTVLLLAPIAPLGADSSSPPSARPPAASMPSDETVELSPFVVNVTKDKGYAAFTTLSGTRLATDLRDTAGSLSILTPELMADLNVNSIAEAVLFFSSGNEDFGLPIGGGTQAGNNGLANPGTRKVRGISTTAASRNFFPVTPSM
jgi:hypothetical protein